MQRLLRISGLAAVLLLGVGYLTACGPTPMTYRVTRFDDPPLAPCTASNCSLRDAVFASNLNPGADTILLPSGDYLLTVKADGTDGGDTGDLDVIDDVTIRNIGPAPAQINANGAVT